MRILYALKQTPGHGRVVFLKSKTLSLRIISIPSLLRQFHRNVVVHVLNPCLAFFGSKKVMHYPNAIG